MALPVQFPGGVLIKPPRAVAARTVRKVALCGSHSASLKDAPWTDPSWEFWGHSSSRAWYSKPMDRYFDLHPPVCWTKAGKKGTNYTTWLAKNVTPIYMQRRYPEIPASLEFPKGRILTEFSYAHGRHYFSNQAAWMIAMALTEGVTHIGLFGINYGTEGEYFRQRGSAEYWLGQCDARGIAVHLPEACTLLRDPVRLYGYDSHDEKGLLLDEYKKRKWQRSDGIIPGLPGGPMNVTEELKQLMADEEQEFPRPAWSLGPERTDGGLNGRQ